MGLALVYITKLGTERRGDTSIASITNMKNGMPILLRNCNSPLELLRQSIMVHGDKLPACLVEQVAQSRYDAFLPVEQTHHLRRVHQPSVHTSISTLGELTIASKICPSARARPQFGSKGLGGAGSTAPGMSCMAGSSQA